MGFVKKYWHDAEEKQIPHYHRIVIVELQTGAARVQRRGLANVSDQQFPELPLEFPTYDDAFAWVERKLTPLAPDRLESAPLQAVCQPELFSIPQALSTPTNGR